jgi:hypothetical protein
MSHVIALHSCHQQSHKSLLVCMSFAVFITVLAFDVTAKETVAVKKDKPDPSIVILRDVAPRIAYRALPKEDLPVSAQATLFPSKVFHQSMGMIVDATASDSDLMQHASVGLLVSGLDSKSPLSSTSRLLGGSASSSVGVGASARRTGGSGGVAGRITSVTGQLSSLIPAAINQTTKPIGPPGG